MPLSSMERLCIQNAPYVTPKGFYDVPYVYSKSYFLPNTSALISNATLLNDLNDSITIDGDSDFILRKVGMNFSHLAATFNFQDALQYYYFSQQMGASGGHPFSGPIMVTPEKMFPGGGSIQYTIGGGTVGAELQYGGAPNTPPFVAYFNIYFQGVKRYRGVPDRRANYKYWERQFTYVFPFNLNFTLLQTPYNTYTLGPTQYFSQLIDSYDFELMQIGILPSGTDAFGYEIQLYDQAQVKTSNDFIPMNQCVSGAGQFFGGFSDQDSNNCFPTPSLIYPQNATLRFAIRSLADTSGENTGGQEVIYFKGVQRIPC
jgi:hypothetical protein